VDKPKKVCIIGLDAALPKRILKYVEEGALPNFAKLIGTGVIAENCLVPHPTITPPNWTTIATGSWPGTHGITDYHVHYPGDPLDMARGTHQGFNRDDCLVENMWEAAEKAGKKCIVFNFPSSWPSRLKDGILVGGNSNIINDWRPVGLPGTEGKFTVSMEMVFSTFLYPRGGVKVEFSEADGWENVPQGKGSEDLETAITLTYPERMYEMAPTTWYVLVQDGEGKGYDRITLSPTKDYNDAFCTLRPGEWSKKLTTTVSTKDGVEKEVTFHAKLIELSDDAGIFRLFLTGLAETSGWSTPAGVDKEIVNHSPNGDFGLRGGGIRAFGLGWIDLDTYVEMQDMENEFLADGAEYLMKNKPWDIFAMHAHAIDWMEHAFFTRAEPLVNKDEASVKLYQDGEKRFYQSIDKMVGRIVDAAGKDAVVVIISDHGAVSSGANFNPWMPLLQKGLLKVKNEEDLMRGGGGEGGVGAAYRAQIDWSQSKAIPQRSVHIYVNLKGRDPDGIVEPDDYDNVRQEIIDALMTYVDPATGKRPFAMALRREDARPFGMYGDRAGDVIYAVYPWFGGQHGYILPTAEWGIGSIKGLFVMNGPGIKKGQTLQRTVWITDMVPTLCYLTNLPLPEHVEGAVIFQAFEDPNFRYNESAKD